MRICLTGLFGRWRWNCSLEYCQSHSQSWGTVVLNVLLWDLQNFWSFAESSFSFSYYQLLLWSIILLLYSKVLLGSSGFQISFCSYNEIIFWLLNRFHLSIFSIYFFVIICQCQCSSLLEWYQMLGPKGKQLHVLLIFWLVCKLKNLLTLQM